MEGKVKRKKALRPDTTLAPVGKPQDEVYVRGLPACCLRTFKEAVVEGDTERFLELTCSCGRSWNVMSSLDERVLERFVTCAGRRVGGSYPAA